MIRARTSVSRDEISSFHKRQNWEFNMQWNLASVYWSDAMLLVNMTKNSTWKPTHSIILLLIILKCQIYAVNLWLNLTVGVYFLSHKL